MPGDKPHSVTSSAWRFLLVGGINTLVTGVLLSVLAQVIDPRIAYTIVFTLGVAFAVAMAGGFVYGVRMTRRQTVLYVLLYLGVYLVGLLAVAAATSAGMPRAWSGAVVLVTAPLTFIGGRLLLTRGASRPITTERTS